LALKWPTRWRTCCTCSSERRLFWCLRDERARTLRGKAKILCKDYCCVHLNSVEVI
jgi:hypothetical protein